MIGLGTIVNGISIVIGGLFGLVFGRFLNERIQETVIKSLGFATMFMAIGSCISKMLVVDITQTSDGYAASFDTAGVMMMIVSLALGAFLGEIIDLDGKLITLGEFLKKKSGSQSDTGFLDAFILTSLTVGIGAMAVMGAIQDGLNGDYSTLFAKSLLDLVFVFMMTSSLGKGCIFSAVPVVILQGSITLLARFIAPFMTPQAVSNLSLVGGVLIFCVGINIIFPKTVRVANLLPAIVVAVVAAALGY